MNDIVTPGFIPRVNQAKVKQKNAVGMIKYPDTGITPAL